MTTLGEKVSLSEVLSSTQLPALPLSAVEILRIAQNPDSGPEDFVRPIEADVGLLGQVLRFVNSAYFGFSREITSIQQAITLLGIKPIQNFALWSAVFSLVPSPKFGSFDLKLLWQDSIRRGILSRELGKARQLHNCEELFAASLLQDIAIPILLKSMPEVYEELIVERLTTKRRLSEIERDRFGWDHAKAAATICRNWCLPEVFAELIENHSHPSDILGGSKVRYDLACVAVASLLPACCDADWHEQHEFFNSLAELMKDMDVNFIDIFRKVDELCEEFSPLLKVPPPERTLSDWFLAAVRELPN